jgi:hypothetical protein
MWAGQQQPTEAETDDTNLVRERTEDKTGQKQIKSRKESRDTVESEEAIMATWRHSANGSTASARNSAAR